MIFFKFVFFTPGVSGSNELTEYLATNLDVTYEVLDNFAEGPVAFRGEIVFTNKGERNVTGKL